MTTDKTITIVWCGSSLADYGGGVFHAVVVRALEETMGCKVRVCWIGCPGSPANLICYALTKQIDEIIARLGVISAVFFEGSPNGAHNDTWFHESTESTCKSFGSAATLVKSKLPNAKIIFVVHAYVEAEGLLQNELACLKYEEELFAAATSEEAKNSIPRKFRDRVNHEGASLRPIAGKEGEPRMTWEMLLDLHNKVLEFCIECARTDPNKFAFLDMWAEAKQIEEQKKPPFFDHIHWSSQLYDRAARAAGVILCEFGLGGEQAQTGSVMSDDAGDGSQVTGSYEIAIGENFTTKAVISVPSGRDKASTVVTVVTTGGKPFTSSVYPAFLNQGTDETAILLAGRDGTRFQYSVKREDLGEEWDFHGNTYDPDTLHRAFQTLSLEFDPASLLYQVHEGALSREVRGGLGN